MSMRWIQGTSEQESLSLVDSQDEQIAEVFEVQQDEWHWNVLDIAFGVTTDKAKAMEDVYGFIGVRPYR